MLALHGNDDAAMNHARDARRVTDELDIRSLMRGEWFIPIDREVENINERPTGNESPPRVKLTNQSQI